MKKLRFPIMLVCGAALLAVTGCTTVSTTTTQAIGAPTFPPTNPAQVQILTTPPMRPHVRLGEVRAEPATESVSAAKIQLAIQQAAAKLGADAAVIVADKTQIMGAMVTGPWWGRQVDTVEGRVVIAVAIKYQ